MRGLYQDIRRGIPRGSSLSPLLGAFYLLDPDREMEKLDVKYFRYMDDILILAPTRWKLKKAIRVLYQTFKKLGLEKHPDKTLIGSTERGFDFLGYHFGPEGLSIAQKTINKFVAQYLANDFQKRRARQHFGLDLDSFAVRIDQGFQALRMGAHHRGRQIGRNRATLRHPDAGSDTLVYVDDRQAGLVVLCQCDCTFQVRFECPPPFPPRKEYR